MAITSVTTFEMDREQALRIAGQVAPILKRHGATAVRFGFCYSGGRTGTISVVVTYPDWQTYGRAAQATHEDNSYHTLVAEAMKTGKLLDRSIMVMQDL